MLAYKKILHEHTITPYFIKRELMVHCTSIEFFCRIISDTHHRKEQKVYAWMTTSDVGFPVAQVEDEVQC